MPYTRKGAKKHVLALQHELWVARQNRGVTQVESAARIGVAARTLRKWEKGYDTPEILNLMAWGRENRRRLVLEQHDGEVAALPEVAHCKGKAWEFNEYKRLAALLTEARHAGPTSQVDLALLLQIKRESLRRWETASVTPMAHNFVQWAGRFNLTPVWTPMPTTVVGLLDIDAHTLYEPIPRRLRLMREALPLTQRALAGRLSVATGSIADWETLKDFPSMSHLILWAAALRYRLEIKDPTISPQLGPLPQYEALERFEMRRIAAHLSSRREARGISQAQVGEALGVSRISVGNWESARLYPRVVSLIAWCSLFDCRLTLYPM